MNQKSDIYTLEQVNAFIDAGHRMLVAADESLLSKLKPGDWIGGTIPYFMSQNGGLVTRDKLFVNFLPAEVSVDELKFYGEGELQNIPNDYPENGISFIIIPALSASAQKYAAETCKTMEVLNSPLVGWLAGVMYEDVGKEIPKVFNGNTGVSSTSDAVVMHCRLPDNISAVPAIINIFEQGDGDLIEFDVETLEISDAIINGQKTNFYDYLNSIGAKLEEPLVANHSGAKVNTSFMSMEEATKTVKVWAPVQPGYKYKMALPVHDYEKTFSEAIDALDIDPIFTCNCLYNYLFGGLEGKKTGEMVGPITFGEIAYLYLNQTMVYVTLEKK